MSSRTVFVEFLLVQLLLKQGGTCNYCSQDHTACYYGRSSRPEKQPEVKPEKSKDLMQNESRKILEDPVGSHRCVTFMQIVCHLRNLLDLLGKQKGSRIKPRLIITGRTFHHVVFDNLDGLVELAHLDLDWVGPHLGLLRRGQRSDCGQLEGLHAEDLPLLCVEVEDADC